MAREKKIRICFLIPSLEGGGAEKSVKDLFGALKKNPELNLKLVAIEEEGSEERDVIGLGARRARYAYFRLLKFLKDFKPDFLVGSVTQSTILTLLVRPFISRDITIVNRVENLPSKTEGKKLASFLYKKALAGSDLLIAVSKGLEKELLSLGVPASKIKFIGNPIDLEEIDRRKKEKISDYSFDGRPTLIGVGRLVEQKGFDDLLREFKLFTDRRPGKRAKLLILGEGPDRAGLEKLIKQLRLEDKVALPGFRGNPYAYMARADVFVLSSRWEGLGNVLLEAMACGLPVISRNCPSGPAEILGNGRNGLLVDPEKSLADAMESLVSDQSRVREYRQRGKEAVKAFSLPEIVEKYLQLFEDAKK